MKEEEELEEGAVPTTLATATSSIPTSTKITENGEIFPSFLDGEEKYEDNSLLNGHGDLRKEEEKGKEGKCNNGMADGHTNGKPNDEFCFKTPAMPSNNRKSRPSTNKKRTKLTADTNQRKSILSDQTPNDVLECSGSMVQYTDEELLRDFVGIGKHSFLCPHSQHFLAKKYPGIVLKKESDDGKQEDVFKEIVVDEFSLLLFRSMDDFNAIKEREDKVKEREELQAKQKQYEENVRLGKIKKKGRKSKLELKREKKEAKRRAREERKEQRSREREERKKRKLVQQQQAGQGASQDEERKERKEALKLEREKRRDEKKRQKQAKKIEEKRSKEKVGRGRARTAK